MLEVDGLFYHFILILGWKWSSIIYRYWLNQLEIHYLWGIDTFLYTDTFKRLFAERYITYEELTRWCNGCSRYFNIRDTLPMRNWHSITSGWSNSASQEIHYLWGIDTRFTAKFIKPSFERYITYEELTHFFCMSVTAFSKRYITYEELTRFIKYHHSLDKYLRYITYEELTRLYLITVP